MVVLLFGPPGCGKGTQAAAIASRFEIPIISTGELFRAECKAGTPVGLRVSSILAKGGLVGDDVVNELVANRLSRLDCAHGFLLDGYPRTLDQARYLASLLEGMGQREQLILHLDVPVASLVARLAGRRQCSKCRRIYNLRSQPPRISGRCDDDRAALITREDDRESVIRERLRVYQELTGPILNWYGSAVHRIDGNQPPEFVAQEIEQVSRQFAAIA